MAKKLNIYQTSRSGSIVLKNKKLIEILPHTKYGKIISPANEEEDKMLQDGPGFNTAYWIIDPTDLGPEGNDLRLYKVITTEKLDKLFGLPEKEQSRVIAMLNDNLDALIEESVNPAKSMTKPDNGSSLSDEGDEGFEEGDVNEDGMKKIGLDDITVKELQEILTKAEIPFEAKAKKEELYRLVYPE